MTFVYLPLRIVPPTREQATEGRRTWKRYRDVSVRFTRTDETVSVSWAGPTWAPVRASEEFIADEGCARLLALPWKLRFVSRDMTRLEMVYARSDGWRVLSWAFWRARAVVRELKSRVKRNIFIFFYTRGLLHTHEGAVPQWRDIEGCWTQARPKARR